MKLPISVFLLTCIAVPAALARSAPTARKELPVTRQAPVTTVTRTSPTTTRTTTIGRPAPRALRKDEVLARVTVYWAKGGRGSDRYTRKHQTSTGQRLRTGHCAVDPKKIPYGSRVVLPTGETLAAVDTGTAVKNRKAARQSGKTLHEKNALVVDRFFETKRQALAWAASHPAFMPVKVVPPRMVARQGQQIAPGVIRPAGSQINIKNQPVPKNTTLVASNTRSAGATRNKLGR